MDINKHLERAAEAVRKKNFDYGISLFSQALALKPDHYEARLGLLQAAGKKLELKSTPKALRLVLGLPGLLGIGLAMITRNSDSQARACQRYLLIDPYNAGICIKLGQALEGSGFVKGATAVYEFVSEFDEKNVAALKKAGFLKYRLKDVQAALEFFEKALAIAPRDAEAEKMRKNLAAEDTLASGSYSRAGSSRDLVADKEEATKLQREARIHRGEDELEDEETQLREVLNQNPGDKRARRNLVELLIRKKDYRQALGMLEEILQAEPTSFEVRCRIGDVKMLLMKERIDAMEKGGASASQVELAGLKKELLQRQVEEFSWRVKEHPTDLNLWYKLGRCAFASGEVDSAIEAFQNSVKVPRRKTESLQMLGRCFREKSLFDLALKQFESALQTLGDSGERTKEVIYDLGDVTEKMGDRAAALKWFSKIYEIDIKYRDVASKIESLKN